jgi:hypothetical protein
MTTTPIICFGQQPCGFFPRRFLFAKFQTARRLQAQSWAGRSSSFITTATTIRAKPPLSCAIAKPARPCASISHTKTNGSGSSRRFSPNASPPAGRAAPPRNCHPSWTRAWVEAFQKTDAANPADFCLEMYRRMGLLDGVRVARSGDPAFRRAACDVADFFVDVPHEGETGPRPLGQRQTHPP